MANVARWGVVRVELRVFARTLCAVALAGLAGSPSAAENRVLRAPDDAVVSRVAGSVRPLTRGSRDLGRADSGTRIEGASVVFSRSPDQQKALDALLALQQDRSSTFYRKWLTPEDFADRFGLSRDDVARVVAWLRSRGFTVDGVSRSRTRVSFSGTFGQVESAFRTEMHWYERDGERRFANATELSVPEALSGVVQGFRNLDDFRPRPGVAARAVEPLPDFTSSISGNHYLAPEDVAIIYNVSPLHASGHDGTGQTIAVAGQTQIDLADVRAFRSASNLPARDPLPVLVPNTGSATVRSADLGEADLDVEWAGAIAPNAQVLYVFTGSDSNKNVIDALVYAIDNDLAPVLSLSYGDCETDAGATVTDQLQSLMQQANAQGQTLSAASGDWGAADCDSSGVASATHGLSVDVPASIPEVTGVGGTEFVGDVASPASYWSPSNDASSGSALGYIPEGVWNETAGFGKLEASGGGASAFFSKPSWQAGAGVPPDGKRDVPDVALAAAAGHDGYLTCSGGSCVNGYRAADSSLKVVGGTSAAAPSFAGILAILNQVTGAGGLGNVNPTLYGLAKTAPSAFHAISTGNNLVPCTAGSTDCPASGQLGYAAGGGYSLATGLGSVDAQALVAAWPAAAQAATATAVASSAPTALLGTPVALVATVTAAGATPTGTVQFALDGQALGARIALVGGKGTLSTSSLPLGIHSVSASYSGSGSYLASSSPAITESVSDYSVSASPASLQLAIGASGTTTVSLAAVGPFAGSIALSCSVPAPAAVSCSFSPGAVSLSGSAASASSTLTVTAGPASSLARSARGGGIRLVLGSAALLLAGVVLGSGPRRRRPGLLVAALLALAGGAGAGCGFSPGSSAASPGLYTVTISATASESGAALTHSLELPVQLR